MRLPFRDTSELVVGMTLAEIFLFVLFVVWWSNASASDSTGPRVSPTIVIANLISKVRTLEE